MFVEVSQRDWKTFRTLVPQWQESYMERLCNSYIELLSSGGNASDRLWALDKRLREDKRSLGVTIEMRKSIMTQNLVNLIQDGVITLNDLGEFSDELQDEIRYRVALENRPCPRYIFEDVNRCAPPCDGEEIFANGIFKFNITALIRAFADKKDKLEVAAISVSDWVEKATIDKLVPQHIESADLERPVILLEIAPDYRLYNTDIPESDYVARGFVLADGMHRIAKANMLGIAQLPAYLIKMEEHYPFMYQGYQEYMDYWNQKVAERERDYYRKQGILENVLSKNICK